MPLSPKKQRLTHNVERAEEEQDSSMMSLAAKNHCCKVLRGLQEFHKAETFCDYCLVAEDQELKVHRVVMASCSDYFKAMLTGEMRESREGRVELKGVTAGGLRVVVDFAYTGILELTMENVEEVLAAASHLQVTDAVDLCIKYLEEAITVDNCVDILNLVELYSLNVDQSKFALDFMLINFEIVAESSQFYKLSHTQLASMLRENSLTVMSEYRLFQFVLKWTEYDQAERVMYVPDLMKNVRLPLLTGEELVEKVSVKDIMKENKDCSTLLTEAKDYHIVVSKQPLLQNSCTQVRSNSKSLVMCHRETLEYYNLSNRRHGFLRDAVIPMYNPCVVVVDNFMYACGGKYDLNENNEIATARFFRYDPRFDTWYELASMTEARKDFVMVAVGKKLYAIAGQDENLVMCTVERFDIATNEWHGRASMNYSVYGHAGAVCNSKIYVSGGQRFDGCCSDLEMFDPEMDMWEKLPPMSHTRLNHNMVAVSNKLYVVGGNIEDSYGFPVPVIAIECFNPQTRQWTNCQKTLNIREAGACNLNSKIFAVGGINGEHYYSDLVQSYDPEKDELEIVEKFPTRIYGKSCCILTLPQYI